MMLTRCRGDLQLKSWALGVAKRSSMKEARVALARKLAVVMHAMLTTGEAYSRELSSRAERCTGRRQVTATNLSHRPDDPAECGFNPAAQPSADHRMCPGARKEPRTRTTQTRSANRSRPLTH